jgi:parallel beta-helix repeat protein
MRKKLLQKAALTVFLLLSLALLVLARPATSQVSRRTVFIQPDGTLYPANMPIQRNGDTYTFIGDLYDPILIQKSNIVLDGAGYSLIGPLTETERNAQQIIGIGPNNETQVPYIIGIDLDENVESVIIRNLNIKSFSIGTYIRTTQNTLIGNAISDNIVGVLLSGSANTINKNYIANNQQGLFFGFEYVGSIGNIPSDIIISHNSFENNTKQLSGCVCKEYNLSETRHAWDDGKEGNYWSDYNGTDTNNDGLGDMPYIVDILNQDRYPLMQSPASPPTTTPPLPTGLIILLVAVPIIVIVAFVAVKMRKRKAWPLAYCAILLSQFPINK